VVLLLREGRVREGREGKEEWKRMGKRRVERRGKGLSPPEKKSGAATVAFAFACDTSAF